MRVADSRNSSSPHLPGIAHLRSSTAACTAATGVSQCFFHSRNIGYITPEIIYFYYLKKHIFSGSKYPKKVYLILKAAALVCTIVVGRRPFVIVDGLVNMYIVVCIHRVQLSLAIPNPWLPWKIVRYIQSLGVEGVPSVGKTVQYMQSFGIEGVTRCFG